MAQDKSNSAAVQAVGAGAKPDWRTGLERLRGAYADVSLRECAKAFRLFEAWCRRRGRCALPASPETVAAAVEHFFTRYAPATVRLRLAYIRWVHRALELPDPTRHEMVRLAFRRGERLRRRTPRRASSRQATPINAALCERLAAACPDTLLGLRDRALLRLGYDTLCRSGELVALRVEDLSLLPSGGARIHLRRSKTDPFGKGDYVYLSAAGLTDVRAWLDAAELRDGLILRSIWFEAYVGKKGFQAQSMRKRLQLIGRRAGLTDSELKGIGGHSMRVGAAQDLAVAGRPIAQIMRAGRWRSFESVSLYIKHAPVNVWAEGTLRSARALTAPPIRECEGNGAGAAG
jgi:integrase